MPLRTLIGIGLVLAGLVGRARRLSVAYAGLSRRLARCLIRILTRPLIRVLTGILTRPLVRVLTGILAGALIGILVGILRGGSIRWGYLSILRIGGRPCRPPITVLARSRRLLGRGAALLLLRNQGWS